MAKRIVRLALALVVLLTLSFPVNAYMDCYPGKIYKATPGYPYPLCFIDSDNQCLYCVVTVIEQ